MSNIEPGKDLSAETAMVDDDEHYRVNHHHHHDHDKDKK